MIVLLKLDQVLYAGALGVGGVEHLALESILTGRASRVSDIVGFGFENLAEPSLPTFLEIRESDPSLRTGAFFQIGQV